MADFARDLGYLDKFFDALTQHAGTLSADARQRLLALLDEERARWKEIRGLIGGAAPAAAASSASKGSPVRQPEATVPPPPATAPQRGFIMRGLRRLTVGSLIQR